MGGFTRPDLTAAVSEAGAFGMVGGASNLTPAMLDQRLDEVRTLTSKPFGVNFIVSAVHRPRLDLECVRLAGRTARVVEFFYGEPDTTLVGLVHAAGALACWQVGSRVEAIAAVNAGCDLVVAQGIEAGGHVRGRIGTLALLEQVLAEVRVPVLVAGGVGTGRTMAAALAAGAAGVRVGTRFVAAAESDAHTDYKQALIEAEAEDTVYTDVFGVNWPDAPHRVLRSCVEAAQSFEGDVVGEAVLPSTGQRSPLVRFGATVPTRSTTGAISAMSLWAGESVAAVRSVQPAADIVHEIADEAERCLSCWQGAGSR